MKILIAVVVTFIVVALWEMLTTRKIKANQRLMFQGILKEIDEMAVKLGYKDFITYLTSAKGEGYAKTAEQNLKSFYESFTSRGAS